MHHNVLLFEIHMDLNEFALIFKKSKMNLVNKRENVMKMHVNKDKHFFVPNDYGFDYFDREFFWKPNDTFNYFNTFTEWNPTIEIQDEQNFHFEFHSSFSNYR